MFILLSFLISLSFHYISSGYIETVVTSGCESCKIYLTCRHLNSVIAILEANFTLDSNETSFNNSIIIPTAFPPVHPRQPLNQRCSGVNHCSFILAEDCPGADSWGPGNLTIKYACISEDRITTLCNREIVLHSSQGQGISEGFIHNPGYPRFYSSERPCRWKIRAPYEQRVRIVILDISVTADNTIFPDDCTDHLEIIDTGLIVLSICKFQEPPPEIISDNEILEVNLVSTHYLIPQRGVLVYYTAVGCPTPDAPEDGYLVYRNDTIAEYRCCVGFAFPDGTRGRIITCLGSFWDKILPLPNCQRTRPAPFQERKKPLKIGIMASDVLAPALLIVALFLINFLVLFYIYKVKQKHAITFADEELGTLRITTDTEKS